MGECNRLNACEEDCPTVVDGGGSSTDGDIFAAQIQLFDNSTQHVFYLTIFSSQSLTITHTHFSLSYSLSLLLSLSLTLTVFLSLKLNDLLMEMLTWGTVSVSLKNNFEQTRFPGSFVKWEILVTIEPTTTTTTTTCCKAFALLK